MSEKLTKVQRAAKVAGRRMADHTTPFINNMWYIAAFTDEIKRELIARTILGKQLVFFRQEDGSPTALDNRCGHRSFPLSKSKLEGDTIVCGYHGMRYDASGTCIEVPSQKGCGCSGISIRSFPVVERGPVIWIWMGDEELADPAKIPQLPMLEEGWVTSHDHMDLKANYVYLHENLLDLTHLSYLHAATFGTPDYAEAEFETKITEDRMFLKRNVVPTRLPPVWGKPTNLEGKDAARITTSDFVSPALHIVHAEFYDINIPESDRPDYRIKTAHFATPATQHETHYFVLHGRNFALTDDSVTDFMHGQLMAAFDEDVVGLAAVDELIRNHDGEDYYEISVASDKAAVAMRRYLKKLSDAEHVASSSD
ncbi:Rieske 2Fe-2S domain-containing protein [Amphritea sp. HPY]|uniref:Rieske 2Fe-2S domain-containing protein n=1 Tax=Amphritea sp. HPY TaxID=3421652 RepID=UPI003D7E5CB6